MIRTMEQDETVGPVNIGNPVEFTISKLADKVLEKIGTTSKIVEELSPPQMIQPKENLTLHYMKEVLDWTPKIELSEGLDRTIPYFKERPDA